MSVPVGSGDRTHFVRLAEQVLLLAEPFPGPLYDETMFPGPSLHSVCIGDPTPPHGGGEATVLVTLLCSEETLCLGQLL